MTRFFVFLALFLAATPVLAALNSTMEVDLTSAITGNGSYSFAISLPSTNTNTLGYASREYSTVANRPQLIVTTSGAQALKPCSSGGRFSGSAGIRRLGWNLNDFCHLPLAVSSRRVAQPPLGHPGGELDARTEPKLFEDVAHVAVDGPFGDRKL